MKEESFISFKDFDLQFESVSFVDCEAGLNEAFARLSSCKILGT